MTTTTERTPEQIAFDCRVNRIVDWWVSQQHVLRSRPGQQQWPAHMHPRDWSDLQWRCAEDFAGRRIDDPPPDAAMRAAVIAEIDAIADALERRRTA